MSPLPRIDARDRLPSHVIDSFARAAETGVNELHSLMVVHRGQVIAETWWEPFRPDAVHLLYSLSKAFTSTAVGLAIGEGRFGLDDLIVDLFPDDLPETVDENLATLRVRHLLSMSAGHGTDSTLAVSESDDWPRTFLTQPFAHRPGSEFLYDTAATFMLSAIVQRATGEMVVDYLRPRLLVPLGIERLVTHLSPEGIATGGWGMSTTTEAIAKFGLLYLRDGVWNGERVLPEGWVEEATRIQIMQPDDYLAEARSQGLRIDEWLQGYGYQFWRCRRGGYRADGAYGQLCIVIPEIDVVVAVTSDCPDIQTLIDAVWDEILPALNTSSSAPSPGSGSRSAEVTDPLRSVPRPAGATAPPSGMAHGTVRYRIAQNELGVEHATIEIGETGESTVSLTLGDDRVVCGMGSWVDGSTTLPHTPPEMSPAIRALHGPGPVPLSATGAWTDDRTFEMRWQYYETPHHDRVTLRFDGDDLEIEFLNSISAAAMAASTSLVPVLEDERPVLRGHRIPG